MKIQMKLSRLTFLCCLFGLALLPLYGCKKKPYLRPSETVELGAVRNFLESQQHIPNHALLVLRDASGWTALGTRCTKDGCDLTVQEQGILCSCCNSFYGFDGSVLSGPAPQALPFYEMGFKDLKLFVEVGREVKPDYRYRNPAIEAAIAEYRQATRANPNQALEIPQILRGGGDGEPGVMFIESTAEDDRLVEEPVN